MIQPLNGHIILTPVEETEQMVGNIIIPDLGKEKPEIGEVIAVSDTFNWNTGEFKPSQLVVGEKVLIPKLGTMRVSVEGVDYYIVKETDILGGEDPYSASKASAELLIKSYVKSYFHKKNSNIRIASVRAGNVIGGGDCLPNRIIPHLMNRIQSRETPDLRNPDSIRPWQHVLDCLNGYLKLVDKLLLDQRSGTWNFGPSEGVVRTVRELTEEVLRVAKSEIGWKKTETVSNKEQKLLLIDSTKARYELAWSEKYSFEASVKNSVDWYLNQQKESFDQRIISQIKKFESSQ